MKTILTGIKPTGDAHIGNYFGAIKPAIILSEFDDNLALYFIADYHALNAIKDRDVLNNYTLKIAATWLACGLNPEKVILYKQSDISEISELYNILLNFTPKGLLNRAHAYKGIVETNRAEKKDDDCGVNMGLFNYPALMAADILIMNTNFVPVGLDQKQHVEIAQEICRIFNNTYKKDCLVYPKELIKENSAIIYGLDGRKMSKSYGNSIPLFCTKDELHNLIKKIITDSTPKDQPKDTDSLIFKFYELFANPREVEKMKSRFKNGIGWGEVKEEVFVVANRYISPMREKYDYYMSHPTEVYNILANGAKKARKIAKETLLNVKTLVIK